MKRTRNNVEWQLSGGGGAARVQLHSRLSLEGAVTFASTGSPELKLAVTHLIGPPEQLLVFPPPWQNMKLPNMQRTRAANFLLSARFSKWPHNHREDGRWVGGWRRCCLPRQTLCEHLWSSLSCLLREARLHPRPHAWTRCSPIIHDRLKQKKRRQGMEFNWTEGQGVVGWKGEGCSQKHQRASKH